jgi:DNA repair ATPase RecN
LPPPAPPSATSAASLRDYAEAINASPERLAEIEDRLALIDRLKRKYGKTIAEVIAFGEEVSRKLAEVEDRDEILKTLRAELATAAAAYRVAAQALTAERKAAATKLAKLAEAQINSLAMKVKFEVAVHSAGSSSQSARDKKFCPRNPPQTPQSGQEVLSPEKSAGDQESFERARLQSCRKRRK